MYDVVPDPYCYEGTSVLRNRQGITEQSSLDAYEAVATAQRAEEPFPAGKLSVRHYKAFHRHLFQDVYPWAGDFRTVRISRDGSAFCYPEHIAREMTALFAWLKQESLLQGLDREAFCAKAAHFLATLNAIHPFREGNGRTQMTFMALVCEQAGYPLDLEALEASEFLSAMIRSFHGDEQPLAAQLRQLIG